MAERGAAGIYNIVNDEPAPVRDWLPVLAQMVGANLPRRVPAFVARLLAAVHDDDRKPRRFERQGETRI